MFWIIFIIVVPIVVFVAVQIASKKDDKRRGEEWDNLPEEDKKKITREEYIKRKEARETYNSKNTNVLEDKEEAKIIDCPACGEKVSNKAKACPHCGQPIDTKIYCPKCGSSHIEPISGTTKAVTTWTIGVYAANTVVSKYKCKDCGHKF